MYHIAGPDVAYTPSAETQKIQVKRNGFHRVSYPSGDVYEGDFRDGWRQGSGTYYFAKPGGTRYEGQFKFDLFDGEGVQHFAQDLYRGQYRGGLRSGEGMFHDPVRNAT